jgi:hypothetical protein
VQWHALLVAQLEGDDVGVGGHVSVGDALGTPGGGVVPQQVLNQVNVVLGNMEGGHEGVETESVPEDAKGRQTTAERTTTGRPCQSACQRTR